MLNGGSFIYDFLVNIEFPFLLKCATIKLTITIRRWYLETDPRYRHHE